MHWQLLEAMESVWCYSLAIMTGHWFDCRRKPQGEYFEFCKSIDYNYQIKSQLFRQGKVLYRLNGTRGETTQVSLILSINHERQDLDNSVSFQKRGKSKCNGRKGYMIKSWLPYKLLKATLLDAFVGTSASTLLQWPRRTLIGWGTPDPHTMKEI